MTATEAKVTRNGQISLPAGIRHRWDADTVLVIDLGDRAVVRPITADPVTLLKGAHAGPGPSSEEAREDERTAEAASEERRR